MGREEIRMDIESKKELQKERLSKTFTIYPVLARIEKDNPGLFSQHMSFRIMEVDDAMVTGQCECQDMIFLLAGEIKIIRLSDTGEETNLYNIKAGEVCHEYLRCLIDNQPFNIIGKVQKRAVAAVVPLSIVQTHLMRDVDFLTFMYHDLHSKLNYVIRSKEDKLHTSLENRILTFLLAKKGKRIYATHQEIALETDAAREAVSRKLKELETKGYIKLGRGMIDIQRDLSELLHNSGIEK